MICLKTKHLCTSYLMYFSTYIFSCNTKNFAWKHNALKKSKSSKITYQEKCDATVYDGYDFK